MAFSKNAFSIEEKNRLLKRIEQLEKKLAKKQEKVKPTKPNKLEDILC